MNNIQFTLDLELQYKDLLGDKIDSFNEKIVGKWTPTYYTIYIKEEDSIIGYLAFKFYWNWYNVSDIKYDSVETLNQLLNAVNQISNDVYGIQIKTWDTTVKQDLEVCGFSTIGNFPDMPLGKKRFVLTKSVTENQKQENKDIIIIEKKLNKEELDIPEDLHGFFEQRSIVEEFCIAAHEQEDFLGGIYGFIENDYFYLSLLYVEEQHRNKHIASLLMKECKRVVSEKGIYQIYLFTCEFHAPNFYRKLGYTELFTLIDEPKGSKVYAFSKCLYD